MPTDTEILASLNRIKSRRSELLEARARGHHNVNDMLRLAAEEYNALADRCDNARQPERADNLRKEAKECIRLANIP